MATNVVYSRIPHCDPDLVRQAGSYGVSDLHEALDLVGGRMALMSPTIRPLNPGLRIAGQAATVYTYPGDGLFLHMGVRTARPGQILVMANNGNSPSTMFAELVALASLKNGVAGVIVDGSIRDVDALRDMNFPIWFASVYAGHTEKRGPGAVNVPIVCGGVLVNPGDVIVADGDGVICIPRADVARAIAGAKKRADNEVDIRRRIAEGETLFDIIGLPAAAQAAGVVEHDATWNGEN